MNAGHISVGPAWSPATPAGPAVPRAHQAGDGVCRSLQVSSTCYLEIKTCVGTKSEILDEW